MKKEELAFFKEDALKNLCNTSKNYKASDLLDFEINKRDNDGSFIVKTKTAYIQYKFDLTTSGKKVKKCSTVFLMNLDKDKKNWN